MKRIYRRIKCARAPGTKTETKKNVSDFLKNCLTFSTTCNKVIYVSDRTFILCVVE